MLVARATKSMTPEEQATYVMRVNDLVVKFNAKKNGFESKKVRGKKPVFISYGDIT
jgi:hypothetical protein